MSQPDETRDFFISFTGADRDWAAWIAWTIEEAGYSVWFQDWDFKGNFVLEMDRAHTLSRRTIAVLSPAYVESRFAAPEWAARFAEDATSEHDLLVPVRVADFQPKGLLAQIVYVDLVGADKETARERLLQRLAGIRLKPSEPPLYPSGNGHVAVRREPRFPGMVRAGARALHQMLIGGGVLAAIVGALLTWWLTGPGQLGSVTITGGGDVTVPGTVIGQQTIHGVPFEEYKALLAERDITAQSLGVTDQALAAFFAILERDRVPREALEPTLKEIAERYRNLLARLEELPENTDEQVAALKRQAREALAAVDFKEAERLLDKAMALDLSAIERMEADLDARRLSAAETASETGDLQMTQLRYAAAVRYYNEAVSLLPASSLERRGDFLDALGLAAWRSGHYDRAIVALQEALAVDEGRLLPDHPTIGTRLNSLAVLYEAVGRFAEAEPLYERAIAIGEKTLGSEHADLAARLNNLAVLHRSAGRFAEAEPLLERAIAITEKALGPDHPDLAASINNLALLYHDTGRFAEAEPLYERAIAIGETTLGPDHPDLATWLNNLAGLYSTTDRYAEAESLYERNIANTEKALGPEHPFLATGLNNFANLYRATGRFTEAEPLYRRAIAISEKSLGPEHPDLAASLNNLAELYRATGRFAEAEPLYLRAFAIGEKALGPEHRDFAAWVNNLALFYQATGRLAEAEPLHRRAVHIIESALPPDHPDLAVALDNYAGLLDAMDRAEEAAELRAKAQAIRDARAAAGR